MKSTLLGALACCALAVAGCNASEEAETAEGGQEMSPEQVAEEMAAVSFEPGEWEMTSEVVSVEAPGIPASALGQMNGKKTSAKTCMTPDQAANPDAKFLTMQDKADCTYRDFTMRDGKISGGMSCVGGNMPGKVETQIAGTYDRQSIAMDMTMTTGAMPGGMSMVIKAKTLGKRVGECL